MKSKPFVILFLKTKPTKLIRKVLTFTEHLFSSVYLSNKKN